MFEARLPALAGPQSFLGPGSPLQPGPKFMRPSAPLSLSLQSAAGEVSGARRPAVAGPQVFWGDEARLPALAGPHVPVRPGAPLSPGLTEKTRYQPPWFTSGYELPADIFGRSAAQENPAGGLARVGRAPHRMAATGRLSARRAAARSPVSLGAMWLADALSEGPVEDMRDLRGAGNGPHPAVGQLGYLLQLAEVLGHAEDDHQDLDRTAGADHRAQLA